MPSRPEVGRRPAAGPAPPLDVSPARVAGVGAGRDGRVRREREQGRQPGPQVIADLHGNLAIGDADVDVAAADHLVGDRPEVPGHPPVPGGVGQRPRRGGLQRRYGRREQAGPGARGGGRRDRPRDAQFPAQLVDPCADRGGGLDLAARQFELKVEPGVAGTRHDGRAVEPGPAGVGIDEQQLLLDAHGQHPDIVAVGSGTSRQRGRHRLLQPGRRHSSAGPWLQPGTSPRRAGRKRQRNQAAPTEWSPRAHCCSGRSPRAIARDSRVWSRSASWSARTCSRATTLRLSADPAMVAMQSLSRAARDDDPVAEVVRECRICSSASHRSETWRMSAAMCRFALGRVLCAWRISRMRSCVRTNWCTARTWSSSAFEFVFIGFPRRIRW
ncbi:hypothetical protein RHRU231_390100 [Rhodococcus ruber]|uniref:Uncharacterized protein n=1 Tax=Rhodococcus ruber TaxID=1830 RepID=A0A098BHL5_9NOCA|nr:hypothetical protein RHRU231_390100 [Rhodococcus ruber]